MPERLVKFSEVCDVLSGFAFKSQLFGDKGLPIVRIRDVVRGYSETCYGGEYDEKYLLENGDVLLGMDGDFNLARWEGGNALLNQRVCKIIPNTDLIDVNFIYYFLPLKLMDIWESTPFVTVKHLSVKQINNIEIPLPPLPVQKKIAAILEKADTLRNQCEQMEQELNQLAQSVFLDMFGDYRKMKKVKTSPLGDLADVRSGVTKGQKLQGQETITAPYMRVANVQDGYIDLNEIKEIEVKKIGYEKYLLQKGDVLLTEGGDFDKLGRGAVWHGDVQKCIHQNHVFRVRLHDNYLPKYFATLLQTSFAKQYFLKCAKKTTNLASINITQLKAFPMPNETLEKQLKFVEFIESRDERLKRLLTAKSEYETLFNSLMQRAFKGELTLKQAA